MLVKKNNEVTNNVPVEPIDQSVPCHPQVLDWAGSYWRLENIVALKSSELIDCCGHTLNAGYYVGIKVMLTVTRC